MSPERNPQSTYPSGQEGWEQLHGEMQENPDAINPRLHEYAAAKFAEHGINPAEADATPVHDALDDIGHTEAVVTSGFGLENEPQSVVFAETATAVTHLAEESIKIHAPNEDQAVLDAAVAGVVISEPGSDNPIDTLVHDGYEDELVGAVKTLAAEGAYGTAEAVAHEIGTAETSKIDTARFMAEVLQRRETIDKDGIMRPAYTIGGREVVFRTRQETPTYEDSTVIVPGGEHVMPLPQESWDDETMDYVKDDMSSIEEYVQNHQEGAPRIVVTNTPEGMLATAALLAPNEEDRIRLKALEEKFTAGKTWDQDQKDIIDTMLAAVSVDDTGEMRSIVDVEGWAVALAALSGDSYAEAIVAKRRVVLIANEAARSSDPTRPDKMIAYREKNGLSEVEPVPIEQIALVHSTQYDVQRDAAGNIVLRTAGQHREDKYPRASLHFTLNSRVGDVYAMGEKQEWGDHQRIIVANFKEVIDSAHTLPNRMDGVDTWFTINPGQELALPGALVVEPVEETPSGALVEQTESGVLFNSSGSGEWTSELRDLADTYGTYSPKELALRIAMGRVGVPADLMDFASGDGHGMFSHELAIRMRMTASSLGLPSGKHFETPEANMEINAHINLRNLAGKLNYAGYQWESENMTAYPGTAIEARRQALASGHYPARPNALTDRAQTELAERPDFVL